jgi:hypothetical protein
MTTFPTELNEQRALLDHAQELKKLLVDFAFEEVGELIRAEVGRRASNEEAAAHELTNTVERLLFDDSSLQGEPLLQTFLSRQTELEDADRALLSSWKNAQSGLFWLLKREGQKLLVRDLLADQAMTLYTSERDPAILRPLKRGVCFLSRVVPLREVWMLSGAQQFANFPNQTVAYGFAKNIAEGLPLTFFSNPEHVRLSRQLEQKQAELFLSQQGHSWLLGTPSTLESAYTSLVSSLLGEEEKSKASQPALQLEKLFSADDDTLGLIVHSEVGAKVIPRWKWLVDFGEEETPLNDETLTLFRDLAQQEPPPFLEMLAQHYPEPMNELLQVLLDAPEARWETHAEPWFREQQPDWYSQPRVPSLMAFPTAYTEGEKALKAWKAAGRPKKFKWKKRR